MVLAAVLSGCTARTEPPSEETAYVARETIPIRAELDPKSPVVRELPLGSRLTVVGRRRTSVKVRAEEDLEGWTSEVELISEDVRRRMERLREATVAFPGQGRVHAHDLLNVHLEPYRWSPTIYQLRANEGAELLRHRLVSRIDSPADSDKGREEDWYLVRISTGPAGWVLGNRVYSGIPDEIGQYAEGRRIISYFRLGEVRDPAFPEAKPTWLWMQSDRDRQAHDFDRFRVFRWSPRRGAYQTIGMQRELVGRLPTEVEPATTGSPAEFSLLLEGDNGRFFRRSFRQEGQRIRQIDEKPAAAPQSLMDLRQPVKASPEPPNLFDHLQHWFRQALS